jgi:hypothetical protein
LDAPASAGLGSCHPPPVRRAAIHRSSLSLRREPASSLRRPDGEVNDAWPVAETGTGGSGMARGDDQVWSSARRMSAPRRPRGPGAARMTPGSGRPRPRPTRTARHPRCRAGAAPGCTPLLGARPAAGRVPAHVPQGSAVGTRPACGPRTPQSAPRAGRRLAGRPRARRPRDRSAPMDRPSEPGRTRRPGSPHRAAVSARARGEQTVLEDTVGPEDPKTSAAGMSRMRR